MTDWHALKVTDLKEELKSRGIPLTGLKLKQQLVDKLVELETDTANLHTTPKQDDEPTKNQSPDQDDIATGPQEKAEDVPMTDPSTESATTEPPVATAKEEIQAEKVPDPVEVDDRNAAKAVLQDDPFMPETTTTDPAEQEQDNDKRDLEVLEHVETQNGLSRVPADASERAESPEWRGTSKSEQETRTSTRVPTPEILDDQRKRKRRSASPPPNTQDVARKKARVGSVDGAEEEQESEALKRIQFATQEAERSRQSNDTLEGEVLQPMGASSDVAAMRAAKEVGGLPSAPELNNNQSKERHSISPPEEASRSIAPSTYPVTQSIYIRNFKRPLHIPTLRSHISTLARSSNSEEDQVKLFFLDTIRTHAFISFKTTAAAVQVRNAMHDTRFPDEPMREPLWIDFIPDDKVQAWIDEESDSGKGGFGGSRTGRKFEVRYEETADGTRASLHDTANEASQRPIAPQPRSTRPEKNPTDSIAAGVHPERAALVAHQAPKSSRPSQPLPKSDTGKGFKALDELFASTSTKPKLYYKLPEQSVIDERLDMVNTLRVQHADMGRSGDEGMKRYSFEEYRGREEWVDKGPEFGFGRRGQDRLAGFRGRGGGGGGGPRGRRRGGGGGDSWRGR